MVAGQTCVDWQGGGGGGRQVLVVVGGEQWAAVVVVVAIIGESSTWEELGFSWWHDSQLPPAWPLVVLVSEWHVNHSHEDLPLHTAIFKLVNLL